MKRRLTTAVPFLGIGVVFVALAAGRSAFLAVGLAFLVIGVGMLVRGPRGGGAAVVVMASALLAYACSEGQPTPAHVTVRNADYVEVRPIKRNADAEHTIQVDLPYAGAGYGFAASSVLLDLNSFDLSAVAFAGGRTSVAGEATIWLPLTPEGSRRLEAWSTDPQGDYLGIFLKGKLVAAPRIGSRIGDGIPLRVASKSEGDLVLKELRNGGAAE